MKRYSKNQWNKKPKIRPMAILVILLLVVMIAIIMTITSIAKDISSNQKKRPPESQGTTSETGSEQTSQPTQNSNDPKDESKPSEVPSSGSSGNLFADVKYFSDAVFIGDSRTQGLMYYGELEEANFIAAKGLDVSSAVNKSLITLSDGSSGTVLDALKEKPYQKIYIMLGVNELGWPYDDVFIKKYGELIDKIKEVKPKAMIYIQEIMPVTQKKSDSDKTYNNQKITRFNELIKQMSEDKNLIYLSVGRVVSNEDGALIPEASTDGIHLNKVYCLKWAAYLRDNIDNAYHTVDD